MAADLKSFAWATDNWFGVYAEGYVKGAVFVVEKLGVTFAVTGEEDGYPLLHRFGDELDGFRFELFPDFLPKARMNARRAESISQRWFCIQSHTTVNSLESADGRCDIEGLYAAA